MGTYQSTSRDPNEVLQPERACYYELIGVQFNATDNEIKKSYRKLALEHHPDRNINDIQNATRRFAEIQAAYEVLSDPRERAWYDSHRKVTLGCADHHGPDDFILEYDHVELMTTEDIFSIIRRFNPTIPFTDDFAGFYGRAKTIFDRLANEEIIAGDYAQKNFPYYPSFGHSTDGYEDTAKPFYYAWLSFSTRKTFAWKDKYQLSDAPDRRVRRLMEKENQKIRDEAVRQFNDAVKLLVSFVRKRDYRYVQNKQTAAERLETLRNSAAVQAARSRATNKENLSRVTISPWPQAQEGADADHHFSESEWKPELQEIQCAACSKTFKSEKAFETHERSKKHIKAVQQLLRIMKKNQDHSLNETIATPDQVPYIEDAEEVIDVESNLSILRQYDLEPVDSPPQARKTQPIDASDEHLKCDEYTSDDDLEKTLFANNAAPPVRTQNLQSTVENSMYLNTFQKKLPDQVDKVFDTGQDQHKSVGKAKSKRERRAARELADERKVENHLCAICQEPFTSRTKLFMHIRELDHAIPKEKPAGIRK